MEMQLTRGIEIILSQTDMRGGAWGNVMTECSDEQLTAILSDATGPNVVFFYTPFCGTCKLAHRMLAIALEALPELQVYTCNLNYMPLRAMDWQIESVPCLVIADAGKPRDKLYAFQSVDHVYGILKYYKP
jgi:thiol-disulfide isomerase/thioredoxin